MVLVRRQDWPERLAAVIAGAQDQPYVLGQWDCLRFTCAAIAAMTGVDFWPRFAGRYTSRREALRAIMAVARDLPQAVTTVLDVEPVASQFARRGDVILYRDANGEHLGLCTGASVAVLEAGGLAYKGLLDEGVGPAWRVG